MHLTCSDLGRVHNVQLVVADHVIPQVVLSILHPACDEDELLVVYNVLALTRLRPCG